MSAYTWILMRHECCEMQDYGQWLLERLDCSDGRAGAEIEVVEDFCYLGAIYRTMETVTKNAAQESGKREVSSAGGLTNIWRNKDINLTTKVKLYESLVLSTLLYSADLWPLSVTQIETIEAAHHKFQRRLLEISWRTKWKMMTSERKWAWGNSKT